MTPVLCDSGPLIASFNPGDARHEQCVRFLTEWSGRVLVPEPVLGETCTFLRNNVRGGPQLESTLLTALTTEAGDFEIVDPPSVVRRRAADLVARLVSGPLGYVDAVLVAMAEHLDVRDVATVDFKLLGMASPISDVRIRWVLQERG